MSTAVLKPCVYFILQVPALLEFIKLWRKPLDTEILQPLPALVHRPCFNPAQGAQLQKEKEGIWSEKCGI